MRVAVVGAGISGLVAARQLLRAGHDVAVFEGEARPGGHSHTVRVDGSTGSWDVDTGFIVFNDRNYPSFRRLLAELDVVTQPANMSFSVSDGARFEWATRPLGLFANPLHLVDPRFHRMLADLVRFFREARELSALDAAGPSLRGFCAERGFSEYFVDRVIVPQVSAVWSADPERLWSMPAAFVTRFLDNHGALQLTDRPRWRSVSGGSQRYVDALVRPFRDRLRLGATVRAVWRLPDRVELAWDEGIEVFDEVVLACHSDQALEIIADPTPGEREILGAIPYQRNEVVLHTDDRLLPRRRAAWASWNYHLVDEPAGRTTVTYHMNRLQSLDADREFLVTLNRSSAIDPAKVIKKLEYSHPVFTHAGHAAQARWEEISGRNHTHYCGAWWRWGFHEDGVWSALRACERLGAETRRVPTPAPAPAELAA